MKIGIRTPSIKKRISARTTGKINRKIKKATNPLYGKKGMGYINNPKKAVYNKVYRKTTVKADSFIMTLIKLPLYIFKIGYIVIYWEIRFLIFLVKNTLKL